MVNLFAVVQLTIYVTAFSVSIVLYTLHWLIISPASKFVDFIAEFSAKFLWGGRTSKSKGEKLSVFIIGGGFGGLGVAAKLRSLEKYGRGVQLSIFEKSHHVSGTWYFNHYPGCACDIPSHLYSFSYFQSSTWSRLYPLQREIYEYANRFVQHFQLNPFIHSGYELINAKWNEKENQWITQFRLHTKDDTFDDDHSAAHHGSVNMKKEKIIELKCDVIFFACGALHTPVVPQYPGSNKFTGAAFHSSLWPDNLDLSGKRVGVIGSGASAIQFIPPLLQDPKYNVKELVVFQRTPNWIFPRTDFPVPSSLKRAFQLFPPLLHACRTALYARQEVFFQIAFNWRKPSAKLFREQLQTSMKSSVPRNGRTDQEMEEHLSAIIPNYVPGCKRILQSGNFLQALGDRRVKIVTQPIISMDENHVYVKKDLHTNRKVKASNGQHEANGNMNGTGVTAVAAAESSGAVSSYELDAVIYATGFDLLSMAPLLHDASGRALNDVWREGSDVRSYLGVSLVDCPNSFIIGGPNTGLGHNSILLMYEAQQGYFLQIIKLMLKENIQRIEVKEESVQKFQDKMTQATADSVWAKGGCQSWYKSGEAVFAVWPYSTMMYRALMYYSSWTSIIRKNYNIISKPS